MEFMTLLLLLSVFNLVQFWGCFKFSLGNVLKFILAKWTLWRSTSKVTDTKASEECPPEKLADDEQICMDELKTVMHRLGIATEEIHHVENWNIDVNELEEILKLDEKPSLLEIKQVFQVFDMNNDGFIDATEIQRVLRALCMKEGSELEDCRRMVCNFDGNGDGQLDLEEFVVVMENCFF